MTGYAWRMREQPRNPLKVLILAADPLALRGLAAILEQEAHTEISAVESAAQLDRESTAAADVLLWDLGWDTDAGGAGDVGKAVAELAAGGLPVVAMLPDGEPVAAARRLGVVGLLARSARPSAVRAALSAAAAGLHVTDPALEDARLPPVSAHSFSAVEPLTAREREVLRLLAEGLTNRAIGTRLRISENTAKFHVQSLLGKLAAGSRTEAVVQASRLGLLTL